MSGKHSLKYLQQRGFIFFLDALAIPLCWLGAYWFRFSPATIPHEILLSAFRFLPFLIIIQIGSYFAFGLYRGIWRFASMADLVRIIKAVFIGTALAALGIAFFTQLQHVPRSVFLLYGILLISFLGGARFLYRWTKHYLSDFSAAKRVLVIGGGQAGEGLIRDLLREINPNYFPVAILDDDRHKQGLEIHGVRVAGKIRDLLAVVEQYQVELIFIAVPSASSSTMRRIVNLCEQTKLPFRTLPGLKDLAAGNININTLRQVSIEDLLGREPVNLDRDAIEKNIVGKKILVSGGGGSIGSELCRQIAKLNPAALIILENSEFNLYTIDLEIKKKFKDLSLHSCLVDVTDRSAVRMALNKYQPDIIFHAAAYKHVPLLENQLRTAVRNNILGTWILAEEATIAGVKQFTLISTDKAVNPANIMGASKRAAEIICQNFKKKFAPTPRILEFNNGFSNTHFITVRFGNVLESAGSVIPLFRQQIANGGPVTVTHPNITRYFMTIPEATQLILQANVLGKGSEIFVLDMGEPIKISYLAEQMIRLSGLTEKDIAITYTGLRPGEKLYEELFHESENLISTEHEKILQAQYRSWDFELLAKIIGEMFVACETNDESALKKLLIQLVPEYEAAEIEHNFGLKLEKPPVFSSNSLTTRF